MEYEDLTTNIQFLEWCFFNGIASNKWHTVFFSLRLQVKLKYGLLSIIRIPIRICTNHGEIEIIESTNWGGL